MTVRKIGCAVLAFAACAAAHLAVSMECDPRGVPVADIRAAMVSLDGRGEASSLYVECESFDNLGGWTVETQSMRQLGSSYVMAHGYGIPVADAETEVDVPADGRYSVWARTRNWNAEWTRLRSDCKGKAEEEIPAAGRFRVVVDGTVLPAELGVGGPAWSWHLAGTVDLRKGKARIALRDQTGFNGRCDALCFTTDGDDAPERARQAALAAPVTDDPLEYDVIVCGGGIAGCCAALAASRYGLSTLLLQDRGVLGGCNSSEIRVSAGGYMHTGPYPALGNVLEEILPVRGDYCVLPPQFYEDDRKRNAFSYRELPARLRLNSSVYAVETNASGRITAVLSRDTLTARTTRHRARWFVDATGDGVISRLAGCATMYGREERSRWNEACAPEKADRQVMGHSIQWTTHREAGRVPFPDIDWGLEFGEQTVRYVNGGTWWQEAGQYRDMAEDTESIRDYGLLAIFSNWSYVKNRSSRKADWANIAISWVSPVGGKRESHRVYGDYVLTETDLEEQRKFPDGTAVITWDIDFHFPDPENERDFPEPFRSCAYHRGFGDPVAVPYRCLYARDVPNLFLAGRDISVSHGAFAAVRVQRTLGMLGEVVGMAAGICREKGCDPRGVYESHLGELVARMKKGVPKFPQYVAFGGGMHEKYHFADLGFVPIWPNPATNISPRTVESIRVLKMNHRHKHPLVDGLSARRRRFVLADESRPRLHYWDSSDPANCFSIPGERPMWDLKKVGDMKYRAVCKKGFKVFDIRERKVVDEFVHPLLDEVTAVCDMPDGGFVASVNPQSGPDKGKVVLLRRFSAMRELVATYRCEGFFYARSLQWDRDGKTLLLSWEKGFARIRIPATGEVCEVVGDFRQPKGRNLFDVVPEMSGDGYIAGCGYKGGLVRFDKDGKARSVWFVPETDGCVSFFYAQTHEMPDGHIYMAHWTGHGADDSKKGWQVVEFDGDGRPVWHLHDPERFGSISGIDVLP